MNRIERILKQSRITLADKNAERWSDEDLLSILSEGHRDLCLHSSILTGKYDLYLEVGEQQYTLPDDVWELTRVTYGERVLPLVSHSDLDDQTLAKFNIDYGLDVAADNWEASTGSPCAILYDRRNVNELKVFPIPDESITDRDYELDLTNPEQFYGDGAFGVVTSIGDYTFDSPFGCITGLYDPRVSKEVIDPVFGVVSSIQETSTILRCYYKKVPDHIEAVTDTLLTPPMFDTALKYYVIGHAFMNDLNQEYQAKGAQQLGFYDRELQMIKNTAKRSATQASQFTTPYRGAF